MPLPGPFTPVRTRRTFEEALAQIVEAIKAGDLRVGDRLPSQRILSSQMQISRPTLNEAIKLLAGARIVEVKPGPGGAIVRSDVIPSHLLEERVQLRIGEVAEILEARRAVEPRVAQLAGLYATEKDFDVMQGTIDEQRSAVDDRERFLQLDVRFHLAIARATRNSTVLALMRLLLGQIEIARDMAIRRLCDTERAIAIHERTLAAIMRGDNGAIDAVMDEHMSYLERMWEEESGRARLRTVPDFLQPVRDGTFAN